MPDTTTRYPEITVSGSPRELGRQIGEAAGDRIRGFCDIALERVNKTANVNRNDADAIAAVCLELTRDYNPSLIEELQGTAEGEPFSRSQMDGMIALAEAGIEQIRAVQTEILTGA